MNLFGWVLLLAVVLVALADARVASRQRQAASALGPSVAAALLAAFAWLAHAEATTAGRLLLLGLAVTLIAAPSLRRSRRAGRPPRAGSGAATDAPGRPDGVRSLVAVGANLLARLLLVAAALALPAVGGPARRGLLPWPATTALVVLAALAVGGLGLWRLRRAAGHPTAAGVVTAYGVLVLGGAALVAWHGVLLGAAGLYALVVADLVVGWSWRARTVVPQPVLVAGLLLRHLGTALVVVGIVRPDLGP